MENEIMNEEIIETNTNTEPVPTEEDGSLGSLALAAGAVATATLVLEHVVVKHAIPAVKRGGKAIAGFFGKLTKKGKAEAVEAPDEIAEETAE